MWIIGSASKKEIDAIRKMPWGVERVIKFDEWNKFIDSKNGSTAELVPDSEDLVAVYEDLVAVYVDESIFYQLTEWQAKYEASEKMAARERLMEERQKVADEIFENANKETLGLAEEQEVEDHEGWEIRGDHWIKVFYATPDVAAADEPTIKMYFCINFKHDSIKVVDKYAEVG